MKNNKLNSGVIGSSVLTRKAKAQNDSKVSPMIRNGNGEKPVIKKVKKEKYIQLSEHSNEISDHTSNSENMQTLLESSIINKKTQKLNIQMVTNSVIQEKTEQPNDLSEPYDLLLQAAVDPDSVSNSSEINQKLIDIKKFNQQNSTIVFLDNIFSGQSNISPAIFTRTNLQIKHSYSNNHEVIAFENYLNFVTWLYYKKKYKLNEQLINFDEFGINDKAKESKGKVQDKRKKYKKNKNLQAEIQIEESNEKHEEENEQEFHQDILDSIISPIRSTIPFEHWSPKEIAIFETAICKFGKHFGFIQQLIKTKTQTEVNEFYQSWKLTYHYKVWKHYKNIADRNNYNNISLQFVQFV